MLEEERMRAIDPSQEKFNAGTRVRALEHPKNRWPTVDSPGHGPEKGARSNYWGVAASPAMHLQEIHGPHASPPLDFIDP